MEEMIYRIYRDLVHVMTVSGYESRNAEKIAEIVKQYTEDVFERVHITENGSVCFYLYDNPDLPCMALDAHIDTIGFTVKEILPDGFISCVACGGVDARILPASEVLVWANDGNPITGVFCSVPPHLMAKGKESPAPAISDLYIDTGLDTKELSERVSVGCPVSYCTEPCRLMPGSMICGPYLDDKLCAAAAIYAFSQVDKKEICAKHNACLVLSAGEETNGMGAASVGRMDFDSALVLDVNFARENDIPVYVSAPIGEGISISYSASTSVKLTSMLEDLLTKEALGYTKIIETEDTGTNASRLACIYNATPCAVASIPISNMHTPVETASLSDAAALSQTVRCAVQNGMFIPHRVIV